MEPDISYVQSTDGTRIAMCSLGSGQPLVFVFNFYVTIDLLREIPEVVANLERLAQTRKVVLYDSRGSGYSSQVIRDFSLSAHVADLEAVVSALAVDSVDIISPGPATLTASAFAARHADRVRRLVLDSPSPRGTDFQMSESLQALLPIAAVNWTLYLNCLALANFGWTEVGRRVAERQTREAKRGVWREANNQSTAEDVSDELPLISCPTLVLVPEGSGALFSSLIQPRRVMEVAAAIPNSRIIRFNPRHAIMLSGPDWDSYLGIIENFLDEGTEATQPNPALSGRAAESGLTVILFADIVDSTALTETLGDTGFRDAARSLDTTLRAVIRGNGGSPIEGKLLGDGVLATFASARQAIEAAVACGAAGASAGLPLHLGLHAGDVIREEDNIFGGAVNIAARVSGLSAPGEVLVSQTVRELARTSAGVSFEDRGEHALKGVGDPVRVWAVASSEVQK